MSGRRMAMGRPGKPAPEPKSRRVGVSGSRWRAAKRLSPKWRRTISSGVADGGEVGAGVPLEEEIEIGGELGEDFGRWGEVGGEEVGYCGFGEGGHGLGEEGIPPGAKAPLSFCGDESPKAKALGYLDARAAAGAKSNCNDRSRSSALRAKDDNKKDKYRGKGKDNTNGNGNGKDNTNDNSNDKDNTNNNSNDKCGGSSLRSE